MKSHFPPASNSKGGFVCLLVTAITKIDAKVKTNRRSAFHSAFKFKFRLKKERKLKKKKKKNQGRRKRHIELPFQQMVLAIFEHLLEPT